MAKAKAKGGNQKITFKRNGSKKRTSIGSSGASRPKHKRADKKRYRGQGRP